MSKLNPIIEIKLPNKLPENPEFNPQFRRAPNRPFNLSEKDTILALKNALRYIPKDLLEKIAPEFLNELMTRGRIYAYRYRPKGAIIGNRTTGIEMGRIEEALGFLD